MSLFECFGMMLTGSDIMQLRLRGGLNKAQLAQKVGVDRKTIGNWENDIGIPNLNQFFAICKGCKVNAAEVLKRLEARRFITDEIDLEGL